MNEETMPLSSVLLEMLRCPKAVQEKEKYGDESVIISFLNGKGIVYHMISHFYLQRTETRDARHKAKA